MHLRKFYMFYAQMPKFSGRVLEVDPNFFHVFCEPLTNVNERFSCIFQREILVPSGPNTPNKINYQILGEQTKNKAKKKRSLAGWQRLIENVCKISGSISHKRRERSTLYTLN